MIAMSGRRTRYPDPDACLPSWALTGYTDAAGGTKLVLGSGCGALLEDWWIYIPWSHSVNGDKTTDSGRRIGRKLSALELIGPLAILCGAPDKVRGQALRIMVDNAGSVAIWRKGYSSKCELSSTLVRAMFEVAASLECRVEISKVTRCSDVGSSMLDAL